MLLGLFHILHPFIIAKRKSRVNLITENLFQESIL